MSAHSVFMGESTLGPMIDDRRRSSSRAILEAEV
jgi:hypothetical protein